MDLKERNTLKKLVEDLVKIAADNKLDYLKAGDIEIKKSIHFMPKEFKNTNAKTPQEILDEDLYWSATPNPRINP